MSGGLASIGERARDEGLDIGFVSMGFAPDVGGIETHLAQLAQEFRSRGHRVHVLCLDSKSEREPYTSQDSIELGVRVRRVAYRYHDHKALADLSLRAKANDAVMAWLAEEPCDVVHVHHASGFASGLLAAISDMGRPLVVTLHDYWFLCPRGQMLRNDGAVCESPEAEACGACLLATWPHLMPSGSGEARDAEGRTIATDAQAASARTQHALEMLALPARVFAPSVAAQRVFERSGVPSGRIQLLENGVDAAGIAARVEALRSAQVRQDGEIRIGVLGSAQPSKGVLELARAVLSLDLPGVVVEVHGGLSQYHGDSSYAGALRELAASDPRLRLREEYPHADLASVLARLDAVAVPSLWNEVFGLSAREARAAGLFVFASDRGGLAGLRGDPGVRLLPPEDTEAWKVAIAEFVRAWRLAGSRRAWPAPSNPRTVHQLALELEQHYVDLVRTQLGREPQLAFEPGSDRPRVRASDGSRVAVTQPKPRGWWQRLWS
ncbi:MAG TPA: glycosyltransferase [Planctomycetota bacterium]|nr:glycosyltransferase [Planctomycetota bacterium]